jgi:hypothetical protein
MCAEKKKNSAGPVYKGIVKFLESPSTSVILYSLDNIHNFYVFVISEMSAEAIRTITKSQSWGYSFKTTHKKSQVTNRVFIKQVYTVCKKHLWP